MLSYFSIMSTNLEIESKVMISKESYKHLLKNLLDYKKYNQTNYYISVKDYLNFNSKYGLRIRKKHRKFELTLKEDFGDSKMEINQKISRKSYIFFRIYRIFPKGEILDFLNKNNICNPQNLRIIGKMKTKRTDINFHNSLISIDKSKYNRLTDYEVECEDTSLVNAETKLKMFLDSYQVKYEKSKYSKLARFLNSK